MANRFSKAAKEAREATNKELAEKIAAVSSFSTDRLNELLPNKRDKEAFVKLMEQVEADTDMDTKLAYLADNIQSAGRILINIISKVV